MSAISSTLIGVDYLADYVPGVSFVTNLVDLFEKAMLDLCASRKTINKNAYFRHLDSKSYLNCVLYMIPLTGNLIAACDHYDEARRQAHVRRLR